jgi:hypothetical protein
MAKAKALNPRKGFSIGMVHDEKIEAVTVACLIATRSNFTDLEQVIMVEGSVGSFDVGRNKIVRHFLDKTNSEWLLTVDSDMVWNASMIRALVQSASLKRPVVSGIYFVNDKPPRPCAVVRGEDGHLSTIPEWEDGDQVEVDGLGGGFMVIHYTVLKDIERVFGYPNDRHGPWYRQSAVGASGQMLEPDHAFVQRVQQLGLKVYVNTDVFVGHVKPRILGYEP